MAKVSIATMDKAVPAPPPAGAGTVDSRSMLGRPSDPIHLLAHRLDPGADMTLVGDPADLAVFVWEGSIAADGATLGAQSSIVIEFGASQQVAAGPEGAVLLAFHLAAREPEARPGGHVHILPADRVPRTDALGGNEGIGGALHADSQCPTCSIWLHENSYAMADKETAPHSHSEDEVIFIHSGSIRLGNRLYGPGTALFIAADTIYSFFSGPDGLGYVNFRGRSPTYTSADGKLSWDEAKLWRDLLGRPEYLETAA